MTRDYTQERRIILALMPLGYGRGEMTQALKRMGYHIGEMRVRALMLDLRAEYVKLALPELLGALLTELATR